MTDEQLIELIETKPPEDLSAFEIDQLRRRLAESPLLRAALSTRLEMEQYLAAALGRVDVSVDDILARAGNTPALRANPALPLLGWVLCLVLVGFVGLVLVLAVTVPPVSDPLRDVADRAAASTSAVAQRDPDKKPDQPATEVAAVATPAEPQAVAAMAEPASPVAPPVVSTVVAETRPAEKKNPWDDLAAQDVPRPSPIALFADIDGRVAPPNEDELKKWFSEAPNQPHNVSRRDYYGMQCGVLDGVWRLQAPLKPKTVLRLTLAEFNDLKLHFWHGNEGISLHYYQNPGQSWAAYSTTRKPGDAKPTTYALATTDEERNWRTNPAEPCTFDLRLQDGVLTLSRGDVRVLSAPFAGAADEIYYDGHALFRQISVAPSAELPPLPAAHAVLVDFAQPVQLKWSGELADRCDFQKLPDGRVELSGEKNAQPAWVAVALPHRESLCEIIVRVDSAQPGTGFFLGDSQGPRYQVGFFREAHNNQSSFFPLAVGDARLESNHDVEHVLSPLSPASPWFRLVFGCGTLKCWVSLDGIHWGRAFDPPVNQQLPYSHFGLYCVQGGDARKAIKLRQLQLRDLESLNALAPVELRRKALALPQAVDMGEWLEAVMEAQPSDAASEPWRRACAIRTLAAGTTNALGTPLVESLLADVLDGELGRRMPVAAKLRLLDDAALLYHCWDDPNAALRFARLYESVGERASRDGHARPSSLVEHAQRTAPIWSHQVYNFLPDALVRAELLELVQAGEWNELRDFCRQERYWRRMPPGQALPPGLLDWADGLAARQLPKAVGQGGPTLQTAWRHPLLVDLSKEGYNVLAELRAALDGRSYRDACQIISTSVENGLVGLLPDSRDSELLVSLPGAVALAMRDHAGLRTTMSEQFGPLGRLRIRQAIAENDADAVESATTQFFSTEAAAEAHVWLGDRALASGAFAHALGQYRQAERTAPLDMRGRIAASQQLAGALMGQTTGEPVTRSVKFGDTELTATELQALLTDLREHRLIDSLIGTPQATSTSAQAAPAPAGFETVVRARLEGDAGHEPQNVPGELNQYNVDWVARQLAVCVDGERLLVSNRFQLAAYDLKSGQLQWRSAVGGEQGHAHEWPLTPMRPLVTTSRIFARRLYRTGPALVAFNSADGKLLWTSKIEPEKWVVSDPLLIQDELFALVMSRLDEEFTLSLSTFDPVSGAVLSARPLIHFRDSWWEERTCQVTANGDTLIIACGGSVLACDLLGQVHWARRQVWVPPVLERSSIAQTRQPPLLVDGRLYVSQPGVRAVVALDPESGRLEWRRVLPGVRRIVGLVGQRLIAETDAGFTALDAASGKPLWQHDVEKTQDVDKRLDAVLCGGSGGLLYTKLEPVPNENNARPALVWVDLEDGRATSKTLLETLKHEKPKFGPLIVQGERLFAFFGRGEQDPNRDIVELTRKGDATLLPKSATGLDPWNRSTDPALRAAAAQTFPRWTLIGGRVDAQTGIQAEWQQEKRVLNTLSNPGRPLKLVRRVAIPEGGNPKLQLRVANDPGGKWKLDVRAGGRSLLEQTIDQQFTGGAWKDLEVDLKPFHGQHIWLLVRQIDEGGSQPYAKWKWLQIVE
jgi:outer membrane protein assembly factor BamB